jgi:transcriptional regulator with XRE-family HTH domain
MTEAEEIGGRIRHVRKEAGLTQEGLAKRLDVTRGAVGNWELGQGVKRENLVAIAEALGVSVDWLATGTEHNFPPPAGQIPLRGRVGAGQLVMPFEADHSEFVEAPPGAHRDTVAVEVTGESMLPAYEEGTLLYYSRQLPPEEMVNRRCVVQLADGRMLVKTLRRGSRPGYWTLGSLNAYDIEDQVVEWAAPIDWIKPR